MDHDASLSDAGETRRYNSGSSSTFASGTVGIINSLLTGGSSGSHLLQQ